MDIPRYQPYAEASAPFRWRLGLRPLDLADWIQIDDHYEAEIAEKARVMADHPDTAFVSLDGVDAEGDEVRGVLFDHLRGLDPDRFAGLVADPSRHPLDDAARHVQEDLVLMVRRDGELICGAGSVCFPNRWDLPSKLGLPMAAIHAPVARLNEQLEAPIDRFLARLQPDRSYWRLGWGVLDTAELYQAVDGTAAPRPVDAAPGDHFLRVERETLRRFPLTGCILFTIRTYLSPLGSIPAGTDAAALADAIESMPRDIAGYKGLDRIGRHLSAWLRAERSTGEPGS